MRTISETIHKRRFLYLRRKPAISFKRITQGTSYWTTRLHVFTRLRPKQNHTRANFEHVLESSGHFFEILWMSDNSGYKLCDILPSSWKNPSFAVLGRMSVTGYATSRSRSTAWARLLAQSLTRTPQEVRTAHVPEQSPL